MTLDDARRQIDDIDEQLVTLLAKRMDWARKTREEKQRNGKTVEDSVREKQVLQHVEQSAKSAGLNPKLAMLVFEEIMAASRAQQIQDTPTPTVSNQSFRTVAFQGERGAYSEEALKQFLPNAASLPCPEFSEVFTAVQTGSADAGLLPIENSTEGSINQVYDLLLSSNLTIAGETSLRVRHNLLALPGTKLEPGLRVYSHPQALAQCRNYLSEKALQAIQYYDTAGAARWIAEEKVAHAAAIASAQAAKEYGLVPLAEGIEDNPNNYTRFVLLSKTAPEPTTADKTSIVFATEHTPGSLYRVLEAFAKNALNLTKIESRPTKQKPWEYVFYLDVEGSAGSEPLKSVLDLIRKDTLFVRVLGSYPRAK